MIARGRFWLAATLLAVLFSSAPTSARAHGGPEKVVGDRFVVSVALGHDNEDTRLKFFLRDFRTGREPVEPVTYRVRILEEGRTSPLYQGPPSAMVGGWTELRYRFPRDGFYEVFFEF